MTMYSVVIPVYNSESIIEETVRQVREFFMFKKLNYEIILVNDGSHDSSWEKISKLASLFKEVIALNLLKNYGQHHANLCGFRISIGEYIITMDDDLQNPPTEIYKLIDTVQQGYDLVIGRYETKMHSLFRCIGSSVVNWLNCKVFGVKERLVLTNFRIIRRDVIDRICKEKSVAPYIPGLVLKYSKTRRNVIVSHQPRADGTSGYTIRKIFRLVGNILFNHSTLPLRYSAVFGFIASAISFFLGLFYFLSAIIGGTAIMGWATLVVLLSFFNGIIILLLSILGEYLIRVLREVNSQQSYEVIEIVRK